LLTRVSPAFALIGQAVALVGGTFTGGQSRTHG
jgi:hypothetical protein